MPASQIKVDERTQYGGQAVVEGVMMRSPRYFAVACRRLSDAKIVVTLEPVEKHLGAFQWLNKPFLRGSLALIDAMALGIKALTYAANVQATDTFAQSEAPAAGAANLAMGEGLSAKKSSSDGTINGITIGLTTVVSLFFGFALFWTFPALLTDKLLPNHGRLLSNLTEGGIRLAIFFIYIGLISQMKHIQRVFQYHGAEHKAINTLERGVPMTVENARDSSRIHPRCGTNFIFIVLITSIVVFSIVPRHPFSEGIGPVLETVGLRLLLLPIVAGIAYEILKWAGANRDKTWAQALIAPGLWTQYLTTRVPDDSQLEVAIASLDAVWAKEHEGVGIVPTLVPGEEPAPVVA
ncbi:MAG: DUF1385 domain-containing protein [Janthinobacterium lividum]